MYRRSAHSKTVILTIGFLNELKMYENKIKSFAQAFEKACRVKGQSPLWEVWRVKPSNIPLLLS